MKKMSKLMALMLVVLMVFMLVPVSALANEEDVLADEILVEEEVVFEEIVVEEVVVEEAVVEEAVVEEAVVEEAVVEEAVVEAVVAEEAVVEMAAVEEAVVEEVVEFAEVADLEEPIAEAAEVLSLFLSQNNILIDVIANTVGANYWYDDASSTLTLSDFTGDQLIATVINEALSLVFHGVNSFATNPNSLSGFAIDVVGDVHLSGPGELIAAGAATDLDYGGGIRATGDVIFDGGSYYLRALAGENTWAADGIQAGNNLIVRDGIFDIWAVDSSDGGAYGAWSYGDIMVHDGWFDIYTYSDSGTSMGMGAEDDLLIQCGKFDILAETCTGEATGLYAGDWLMIDGGCFDLVARGGCDPRAMRADKIWLNPCFGDVDTTASEIHMSCPCGKYCEYEDECYDECYDECEWEYTIYDPIHASSENPKTGVETLPMEVLLASLSILALVGLAVTIRKKEFQK